MAPGLRELVPDAPGELCDILDPRLGAAQPPIRSEIFGLQRFAQHGRSLAETHRAALAPTATTTFVPRLRDNIQMLRQAHRYLGQQASTGYDISPAAEWLLDNFHLIEAQLKEIHDGLPRRYFRALPLLLDAPLAGLPRVYGVAWAFVAHTDGAFDDVLLAHFLDAYQEVRPLHLAELWALPTTVRVVLVENLRRLAERVATGKAAREIANLCYDGLASYALQQLDALLALLERRGVGHVFLAQMAQRLQDLGPQEGVPQVAAQHAWLRHALPDLASLQTQQAAEQAADNLSVSNAVTSLRKIGDADWPELVAHTSPLVRRMLGSPVFAAEHPATRDQTLHAIERLARRSTHSEAEVAQQLLQRMQAAGPATPGAIASHWLAGPGRPALLQALGLAEEPAAAWRALGRRLALPAYLGALALGSLALVATVLLHPGTGVRGSAAGTAEWLVLGLLMLFPASEAVVAVINRLISESARPRHLPRLALAQGIPASERVLVVIPGMLTSAAAGRELAHRLRLHYLANPEREAQFAILSDWADADAAERPDDQALLQAAQAEIAELNQLHPVDAGAAPRFIVLHRARSFSQTEQRWIGWERKRGKLEQLIAVLAEGGTGPFMTLNATCRLADDLRYVVTLDADTQLPPGRLRELVGVAAHPHNQPRLSDDGRRVLAGYGILQPRVLTPLPAPRDFTLYHWLFAGQCGIDPYSAATSEVYQDVFGEGSFSGKGLLHVQAMHAVLHQRLPEGCVLSHDLLEGSIARCAAVTDITVVEDAPFHADVAASRVHRWTRGDWQLLPFLLRAGQFGLPAINRWKMFDNLRRSLVAPMSLALLVYALATLRVSPTAVLWLVVAAFSAGPMMGAIAGFSSRRDDLARAHFFQQAATDLARAVCGGLWHLAQLLPQALQAGDAIVRAVWRMAVSRRHLLQWTTAAAAAAQASTRLPQVLRRHALESLVALALLAGFVAAGSPAVAWSVALCLLWAASPLLVWYLSTPHRAHTRDTLPEADRLYLEGVARDTWRLFERCVGPADHHLPPDNLQTAPHDILARRTSPTNIGLYLLTVACARRFGWIGTDELLARLEATLGTLRTLQRYRGHFMNWYDTATAQPLLPMYVSTVDSGNLSGHLLASAQACLALAEAPYDPAPAQHAVAMARTRLSALWRHRSAMDAQGRMALRAGAQDLRATLASARRDEAADPQAPARLRALAGAFQQIAWEADYSFLYHPKRHLFHIGFRVAEQQRDAGFYDLLASESRLTSLLAIAKGDVPVSHWASLGRPFYAVGATAGLRSWSGSMFEYLMPTLVLDEPHGSVLREACHAAVHEQMAFATAHQVPWGISESAYAGSDHTLAYQYAPQGVPRLALRRTPAHELVIAPYATVLAAQIAPHLATLNLRRLQQLTPRGRYGFVEALDFTPARQTGGGAFTPVQTFMAHHQGMSIVALANVLLDGPAQRWGMADPHLQAVSSLLHERAPREVSRLSAPPSAPPESAAATRAPGLLREVVPGDAAVPPTHLLSNGRYNVSLRPDGSGWSRFGTTGITRWRDDVLRDGLGSFFYLRRTPQSPLVSLTLRPAGDPAARYHATYHADRVCFDAAWPALRAHQTVWVSPEDDIEFRQIEISNLSAEPIEIELVSAFEITLADPRADESHPAFTNLFVKSHWHAEHQALMFERVPRLPTEQALKAAHFLADPSEQAVEVRQQTCRQHWLGRNRTAQQPLGQLDAAPAGGAGPDRPLDTGLDPVCVLAVRLRIAAGAKSRVTFATVASDDAGTLRAVIDKYRQHSHVKRSSLMSATLTGIRLRSLGVAGENFAAIQSLSTAMAASLTRVRPLLGKSDPGLGVCDRRLLWRFGISGDRPLLLVSTGAAQGLGLVRSLTQALRLWSYGGIACDLVVVHAEPASYLMALQRELATLRERHLAEVGGEPQAAPTGFHLLRAQELSREELSTLQALARVHLQSDGRPLQHHVQEWNALQEVALAQRRATPAVRLASVLPALEAAPARGAFSAASGEFRFEVHAGLRPQRPWANVMANAGFGAQITEAGGGYSWALNSRLNQLTAWSNDPVSDPASEWFVLQNRKTGQAWSLAPSAHGAVDDSTSPYRVAHGQGYTVITHQRGDLEISTSWCVDTETSLKQVRVRIVNRGTRTHQLRAVGVAEWLMGASRADRGSVRTELLRTRLPAPSSPAPADGGRARGRRLTALLATQRDRSAGFGEGTAFLALASDADDIEDWTCDRRECFDAGGFAMLPERFGQASGIGLDPCAAIATRITLAAGASAERVFLLGFATDPQAAGQLAAQAAVVPAHERLEQTRRAWDQLLGATTVKTPDPLFDAMVNRWLLYQAVSCRIWAKAGFYQAGGATGFRDQLQDAMALAWAAPAMLREQIVRCASRQFPEGDVQHWWHAPTGAGVRTHFSDDLLWLPYACVHYLRATGDTGMLDEQVPFLEGAAIPPGAEDAYYAPGISAEHASVYEHAARTLDRSLATGAHGLPLMGVGDWNDGMNRVGHGGRGESVWLAWFLCRIVTDFAPIAQGRGDHGRATRWEQAAQGWREALRTQAWDGAWFKRAFFDDGSPLGAQANAEGRIDLIAQAWAVLSGAAEPEQAEQALAAMDALLVDHEAGLLRLLDPPLQHAQPSAGYIQAYPPGVRENGGQYSHAGVWALMAQASASLQPALGGGVDRAERAWRYFTHLSPAHRAADPAFGAAYGIEPYVMAGDVYSQPPYRGRGGWSWYTGSASWLHRAAIESIFGLQQAESELHFTPCLPPHWHRAELTLVRGERRMRFVLVRAAAGDALRLAQEGAADRGSAGAQPPLLLAPGEILRWKELPPTSVVVVALGAAPPAEAAS